ncbi:hypothetical protein BDN70DRAFT_924938 [Pholiota conissans]|uniref:F-box domain-containing protein n=1 Tax=Pholiota conissans TaxID=109636 RepID=A0A9P5YSG4_9AGAR|nr:hypothetical protein BDN70DRAFT_924938 [Pholiota conissans]
MWTRRGHKRKSEVDNLNIDYKSPHSYQSQKMVSQSSTAVRDACAAARNGPSCKLCEESALLDLQIQQMEENLSNLKAFRVSKNEKLNEVHDPLSRLPVELVSKIFTNLRLLPTDTPDRITISPLLLGTICRRWRTISWSIPELWSTIAIDICNTHGGIADIIEPWLNRSCKLPLSINIYGTTKLTSSGQYINFPSAYKPYFQPLMDLLEKHIERWHYFCMATPERFMALVKFGPHLPILDTVEFHVRNSDQEDEHNSTFNTRVMINDAPNLRNVHINGLGLHEVNLNWERVQHVSINMFDVAMICELLRSAPCLTSLDIARVYYELEFGTHEWQKGVTRHDRLASLKFSFHEVELIELLSLLVLPALEDLNISDGMHVLDIRPIEDLLQRSSSNLKIFRYSLTGHWMQNIAAVVDLLKKMPALETLALDYRYYERENNPLISTVIEQLRMSDELFLPSLNNICVEMLCISFSYSPIFRIIHTTYSLELVLPPEGSSRRPSSQHLQPAYIYFLLHPQIHKDFRPVIESGFESAPSAEYIPPPLTEFLQHSLRRYSYRSDGA